MAIDWFNDCVRFVAFIDGIKRWKNKIQGISICIKDIITLQKIQVSDAAVQNTNKKNVGDNGKFVIGIN